MSCRLPIAALALFAVVLLADDAGGPDLRGTWRAAGDSPIRELTVATAGAGLHVTESRNDGDSEWTCGTTGQQCDLRGSHKGTVTAWYNGATLVVLETRNGGGNISKERLELSSDKSAVDIELIPVVPPGKTEKFELRKQ